MKIELGTIKSSPYVGVFSVITDKIALFPKTLEAKEKRMLEKLFDAEIVYANLANCGLLGVLAAGNSNGFIVSEITEEQEIEEMEQKGLRIKRVSGITALGNLIACNDKKAFCSNTIPLKERKKIEDALKVKCIKTTIGESDLVGSGMVLTNKGFVTNPLATEKEFKKITEETRLEGTMATANYGDKFIGNGVIANSNAALAGRNTTGHELIRIDEGLRGR